MGYRPSAALHKARHVASVLMSHVASLSMHLGRIVEIAGCDDPFGSCAPLHAATSAIPLPTPKEDAVVADSSSRVKSRA